MLPPIQIIWISYFISEYAEIALITEVPVALKYSCPKNAEDPLISKFMYRNIFFWTFLQVFIFLLIIGFGESYYNLSTIEEDFGDYVTQSFLNHNMEYYGILLVG